MVDGGNLGVVGTAFELANSAKKMHVVKRTRCIMVKLDRGLRDAYVCKEQQYDLFSCLAAVVERSSCLQTVYINSPRRTITLNRANRKEGTPPEG